MKTSVDSRNLMWHTIILIMKMNVGSKNLMWSILLGLFSVLEKTTCMKSPYSRIESSSFLVEKQK